MHQAMPAPVRTAARYGEHVRGLLLLEGSLVAAWLALAGYGVLRPADTLPPLEAAALVTGPADERWMGLYMEDRHIGWSVSRDTPTQGGGHLYESRATFRLAAMGSVQQVVTAGAAVTDAAGRVQRFQFVLSAPTRLVGDGAWRDGAIHLALTQAGTTSTLELPMPEPPVIGQSVTASLRGRALAPGLRYSVPYFDPVTRTQAPAEVRVESPEVLPDGTTAWWMRTRFGTFETRRLVDEAGRVLREEGAMGLRAVAMTREAATSGVDAEPPDLVALASVPLEGPAPEGAHAVYEISGIEPERVPSEPPLQSREGPRVTVSIPTMPELPADLPVAGDDATEATPSLPATHPEIVARAREVAGRATDRLSAARALHAHVSTTLEKVPTMGVPNGLEVLRTGRGDCNEHTALYVSLARALGIPSRIAAGLVHDDRVGDAFYYHAWPEVRLGPIGADGRAAWVPIDPTLGQFPADAGHLRLVTGDLDRQVEIMGLMGRIRLRVAG
jgi:hypothetical protein